MLIFLKYFIKLFSRIVFNLVNCAILLCVILYTYFQYFESLECDGDGDGAPTLMALADYITLFLIHQHLDSFFFSWLSEKAPLEEGIWVVNKVAPFFIFTCVEIYLLLFYFARIWRVRPRSTKSKLNEKRKHSCRLRFWLGFLNSCFSVAVSCLFTINSFLAAVNSQFGELIIVCFAFTMIYFVAAATFVKKPDYFSPSIGVALANIVTLFLFLLGTEFSQYARTLWLSQLICVFGVCLLFMGLALFDIRPSLPNSFNALINRRIEQAATEKVTPAVVQAIKHKKYINHYLAAINMPKLWLLVTQFIQYTHGLLAAEIAEMLNLIFLLVSVLTNLAFLPAVGYTQTRLYSLFPPISFWLRFESSTRHYFSIFWLSFHYYENSKKIKFPLLYLVAFPYNYRHYNVLEKNLEEPFYFVFSETNNPNNITYRCLTNITGVLFQVVLAYYLLGLNII